MANDKSRKFKQNQISFFIRPWSVEYSTPIVFGEDRLRERGSLPATFYVLTRVIFYMTNGNCRIFKQNQIIFCIHPWIVVISRQMCIRDRPYSLNRSSSKPTSLENSTIQGCMQNIIWFSLNLRLLSFAIKNTLVKKTL